jgi:hypothetical protein
MSLKFKCPKCGSTELEEEAVDVVQLSIVSEISNDGTVDYDPKRIFYDDGERCNFHCSVCDFPLMGDGYKLGDGYKYITSAEDLRAWLLKNCPQN